MMFTESKDGETHHYEDGHGHPKELTRADNLSGHDVSWMESVSVAPSLIEQEVEREFDNILWKVVFKHLTPETQAFIKLRFSDAFLAGEKKGAEGTYTKKEIEELLWLPCCHTSGMHDPVHFEERKYICKDQKSNALERLCTTLQINPTVKSDTKCGWCEDYPKKKKGEGLKLQALKTNQTKE